MSDDEDILVERDGLSHGRMNGMLINVAPFHGLENIGFDDESSDSDVEDQHLRKEALYLEESDFIMALFVVVFDTKHGRFYPLLHFISRDRCCFNVHLYAEYQFLYAEFTCAI